MTADPFTTAGVTYAEIDNNTDLTYRMLNAWTVAGYLTCDNPHPGSGNPRTWPAQEIETAKRMAQYSRAGLTLKAAHHAARNHGLLPGNRWRITDEHTVARVPMHQSTPKRQPA